MNEQVKVRITGQAITARYGTLSTGDQLVTDAAFAKHLVEDCGAAEYVKGESSAPAAKAAAATKEPTGSKAVASRKGTPAKPQAPDGEADKSKPADTADVGADAPAPEPASQQDDVQTSAQPAEAGGAEDAG